MYKKKIMRVFIFILLSSFVFAFSTDVYSQKKPKKKARKLARVAEKLYNKGKYSAAISKYAEALSISPRFPKAHFFKGVSHFRQKQYDLAISELNLALNQGSDPIKVYTVRMEAHSAKNDYKAAMEDAQEVVRLKPKNAYYQSFLGRMYIINGDYQNAIDSLNIAVRRGTRDANVHYFLAVAYNQMQDYVNQGKSAQNALNGGAQFSANAHYLLADAQRRTRNYDGAVRSYTNAINAFKNMIATNRTFSDTESNLYLSYVNLSDVYRSLNLFDDAIRTAKSGLSLRPSDQNLHISLTWYYSLAGRRDDALVAGKRSVELAPNQYMSYTNLCRAYNDQGEFYNTEEKTRLAKTLFNKAVTQCKKALRLQPNDGETNYYLGRAYYLLYKDKLSKAHYNKSVEGLLNFTANNPDYSDGFYLLGNAYVATEQFDKAISAYQKSLQIAPRFSLVRYNLGVIYNKTGEKTMAREQYNKLLEIDDTLATKLLEVIEK